MIRRAHEPGGNPGRSRSRWPAFPLAGRLHPARRPAAPVDRRRLLDEFLHPYLIPLGPEERKHEIPDGAGESLEGLLRRWGGAPLPGWRRRCPRGIADLLASFCRLARLLGELEGAGFSVARLHARWFSLGAEGVIRLRAAPLIESEGEISPDEWAPYLAPELLLPGERGSGQGEPSGVYSLAAILYHCLAGAPPWSGRSEAEVADRLLAGAPPAPIPSAPDLPRGVAPFLGDALALDPRQRPARFRGFAAALEAAARGERPRSSPAHLRGTAAPRNAIARGAALLVLFIAAVTLLQSGAEERDRIELRARLDAARTARPFPLHGEDPPTHPTANSVLGESAEGAQRFPRDAEILVALGWAQLRAGDALAAVASFQRARLWDPRSPAPAISLGIAHLEAGDPAGEDEISLGLAHPARTARERLFRGAGELYLHRFDAAERSFRDAIARDGESAIAAFHLALAAHHAGDDETAERALADAERLEPHDVWVQWLGAERLASRGERDAAVERIEDYKPEWVETEALLLRGAILLLRLGHRESAAQWWARARPGSPFPPPPSELRADARGLLELPARRVIPLRAHSPGAE